MLALSIPDTVVPFLSIVTFALVHLYAKFLSGIDTKLHGRFLSIGGGIALSYVFIDLMPKLCKGDELVRGTLPFEKHVYVLALLGFLLFFLVGRTQSTRFQKASFALSLCSYALFNFLVGYAVTYKDDPDIQPLILFTIAIALHYFTNDYTLNQEHEESYNAYGRWVLIAALFMGWVVGSEVLISPAAIALVNAFIGGGVIMNVTRHELSPGKLSDTGSFLLGAAFYAVLLLTIGNGKS